MAAVRIADHTRSDSVLWWGYQALVLSYFKHEEVSAFIKDFLLTEVRRGEPWLSRNPLICRPASRHPSVPP